MPNIKAAKKDEVKSEASRLVNKSTISRIKTERKKFLNSVTENLSDAKDKFISTQSLIAKAAKKRIIHWKKAARLISRMAQKLKKSS
jgi:small subunit ribosomal protein S20